MALDWNDKCCIQLQAAVDGDLTFYLQINDKENPPVTCWYEKGDLSETVYTGHDPEMAKTWAEAHYQQTFKGKI